jgi:hypothetical protein
VGRDNLPDDDEQSGRVEIIPPDAPFHDHSRVWVASGSHRVKIVKLGPFGSLMTALAIGLVLLLGVVFLTSAFLILVPVVALLAAAAYISGKLGNNPFNRLR